MAKHGGKKISISSFFEFSAGKPSIDLVDILLETEKSNTSISNFDNFAGYYKYRVSYLTNNEKMIQLGVDGLSFTFCKENPQQYGTRAENIIEKFEVRLDDRTNYAHDLQVSKTLGGQFPSETKINPLIRVIAGGFGELSGLPDALVIPNTHVTSNQADYKTIAKLLSSYGSDPAQHASAGNFSTISPSNALSLDSSNTFCSSHEVASLTSQTFLKTLSISSLRASLRRARRGIQNNVLVRTKDTPTNVGKSSGASHFDLLPKMSLNIKYFQFSKNEMQGTETVYLVVSPITKKQAPKDQYTSQTVNFNHRRNVENFLVNPEPPEVTLASATYSYVKFRIKRTDPTLKTVKIVRIVSNSSMGSNESHDVDKISFAGDDTVEITDFINNVKPNRATYRFSTVNSDGSLGEFTSIVVPSFKKISDPLKTGGVPLSIRAINQIDGVALSLQILTDDILSVRLLRQEIGKTGEFSNSVSQILDLRGNSTVVVRGSKAKLEFLDKTAILGRKYRYFVAYRRGLVGSAGLGEEIMSDEDETIIRRFYLGSMPFNVTMTDPVVTNAGNSNVAISFDINSIETKELFNTVIASLQSAGVGSDFISQLQSDNVKSKLFTMFLIERFEFETGRRVSFGIFPAGTFSDSPATRLALQIPAPKMGNRYSYIVKTCLQAPEVFLQTTNVGIINALGTKYDKSAARFARQIYSRLGVLPPEIDIKDGVSIENLLLESQIGLEIYRDVDLASYGVQIQNLNIEERSYCNDISWNVSGNMLNVSYFLIYCSVNNEENLLGAISASKSVSLYHFRDDRYFGEVGKKSYRVAAVNFENDETVNSPVASIDTLFSVPENLITGNVLSTFGKKKKIIPVTAVSSNFGDLSKNYTATSLAQNNQIPGLIEVKHSIDTFGKNSILANPNMPAFGAGSNQSSKTQPGKPILSAAPESKEKDARSKEKTDQENAAISSNMSTQQSTGKGSPAGPPSSIGGYANGKSGALGISQNKF